MYIGMSYIGTLEENLRKFKPIKKLSYCPLTEIPINKYNNQNT